MPLFQFAPVRLASGKESPWKIDCDALTNEDWLAVAQIARLLLPGFGAVEGVPRGGLKFAGCLRVFADPISTRLLIVDDVLTTGGSMERQRANRAAVGVVLFARGPCPPWVRAVFHADPWIDK